MFDNISQTYDRVNSILTLGIDRYWRKKTIQEIGLGHELQHVLDVATGTGALALQLAKARPNISIIGVDISKEMLHLAEKRVFEENLGDRITLEYGDSENLPYPDEKFDYTMAAFGVRNFEDLELGLTEMIRVTKKGGKIVILEFSKPRSFPIKQLYGFYFKNVLPSLGKILSKDPKAYTYLFESVQHFPDFDRFIAILESLHLTHCKYKSLSFGICCVYTGIK